VVVQGIINHLIEPETVVRVLLFSVIELTNHFCINTVANTFKPVKKVFYKMLNI